MGDELQIEVLLSDFDRQGSLLVGKVAGRDDVLPLGIAEGHHGRLAIISSGIGDHLRPLLYEMAEVF